MSEEHKAAVAAELADGIIEHPRKLVFVAILDEGNVLSSLRTTDFPDEDLQVALRDFLHNSRNMVGTHKREALQGVDKVATEAFSDEASMGTE